MKSPRVFAPGAGYMVTSAFAFSVMALLVKRVGREVPTQELVFCRNVIVGALSWVMLKRAGVPPWGTHRPQLLLRGLFGYLALSGFYHAVTHLPMAEATVIQYTNPVMTALLAAAILGERITATLAASTVACMLGVVLVCRPALLLGGQLPALDLESVAFALAGAFFSASAYVTVRWLGAREHPVVIVWYFPLVSIPCSLPGLTAHAVWPTGEGWLELLGIGLFTQLGQVSLTRGLAQLPAGTATAVSYLQVLFAVGWGALLFGEVPGQWTLIGGALVVSGTLAAALRAPAREPVPAAGSETTAR